MLSKEYWRYWSIYVGVDKFKWLLYMIGSIFGKTLPWLLAKNNPSQNYFGESMCGKIFTIFLLDSCLRLPK